MDDPLLHKPWSESAVKMCHTIEPWGDKHANGTKYTTTNCMKCMFFTSQFIKQLWVRIAWNMGH